MRPVLKNVIRRRHPLDVVRFIGHLPNFVKLFLRLIADARVSWAAKGLLVAAAVYVVSPLDFLPDVVPFAGAIDDLALFGLACRMFIQMCPPGVAAEHVARLDQSGKWRPFEQA